MTRGLIALLAVMAVPAWGQIRPGPVGTLVVASRQDSEGQALAAAYMRAWDVPQGNLCMVDWPTGKMGWRGTKVTAADVAGLKSAIDAHIAAGALEVDRILLCGHLPYAYWGSDGARCSVQAYLATGVSTSGTNAYYRSQWGTASRYERTGRQVFTLYAWDLAQGLALIERSRAA